MTTKDDIYPGCAGDCSPTYVRELREQRLKANATPTDAELAQARADLHAESEGRTGLSLTIWMTGMLVAERAKYNRAEQRAREAEEALANSRRGHHLMADHAVRLEAQLAALSRECGPSCASELQKANERAAEAERECTHEINRCLEQWRTEVAEECIAREAAEQRCQELGRTFTRLADLNASRVVRANERAEAAEQRAAEAERVSAELRAQRDHHIEAAKLQHRKLEAAEQRIDELELARDALHHAIGEAYSHADVNKQRCLELEAALTKYGWHTTDCEVGGGRQCSCGWEEALQ